MSTKNYEFIETSSKPIKAWVNGVQFEEEARKQVINTASLPFIFKHISIMPDVHSGKGSTVGSVVPTKGAIIPACVGVDLGCGMMCVKTTLKAKNLPDNLFGIRAAIEKKVPHGRTNNGGKGDRGAWTNPPNSVLTAWHKIREGYEQIIQKYPKIETKNNNSTISQLCSLGTGNHFLSINIDELSNVWFMLHSGSRGVGNRIGTYFINIAKEEMKKYHIHLIDQDLSYLSEGTEYFNDYCLAVEWAQNYAKINRELMMQRMLEAVRELHYIPPFQHDVTAIQCHHNYISKENHFGEDILVTRKGAVRADKDMLGIIPGSMGQKNYIVRGLGNPDSFNSCSHGAGRVMSRTQAKKQFTLEDHIKVTEGVECRKDVDVIDETPMAYKDLDMVMEAQKDLVEIVYTLKEILTVKG